MWTDLLAVVSLALLTGARVAVQRRVARSDPGQPGVEGSCHGCRGGCPNGVCRKPGSRS
jgi:hypothetical protein